MRHAVPLAAGQNSGEPPRRFAQAVSDTAGAAEVVMRGAVGTISVQTIITAVRDHPVLALLLASGVGYLFGLGGRSNEAPRQSK